MQANALSSDTSKLGRLLNIKCPNIFFWDDIAFDFQEHKSHPIVEWNNFILFIAAYREINGIFSTIASTIHRHNLGEISFRWP